MPRAYRDDLAYIHDAGFGELARQAAGVLVAELRRRGVTRGLVVDLGCGSGILAERVVAAGYGVEGIDLSPAMIARARARVPRGRFRRGSLLTSRLPAGAVAVTATGEAVNYLFDERGSMRALQALAARVFDALAPGGLLLFDSAGPGRVPGPGSIRNHFEGPDWALLWTAAEDRRRRLVVRTITWFRKTGAGYRRGGEVHRLRLYPPARVAATLRRVGFVVRTMPTYGRFAELPGLTVFVARKPS